MKRITVSHYSRLRAAPGLEHGPLHSGLRLDCFRGLQRAHRVGGVASCLGELQGIICLVGLGGLRNHFLHFLVTHRVLAPKKAGDLGKRIQWPAGIASEIRVTVLLAAGQS